MATVADLEAFRDILRATRDFVRASVQDGLSLSDVLASAPDEWTSWNSRYLTVDSWLEQLYESEAER